MRIFAKQNYGLCGIKSRSNDWATSGLTKLYLSWCSVNDPNITLIKEEQVYSEFIPGLNSYDYNISEKELEQGEKFIYGQQGCKDDSECKGILQCINEQCHYIDGKLSDGDDKCENGSFIDALEGHFSDTIGLIGLKFSCKDLKWKSFQENELRIWHETQFGPNTGNIYKTRVLSPDKFICGLEISDHGLNGDALGIDGVTVHFCLNEPADTSPYELPKMEFESYVGGPNLMCAMEDKGTNLDNLGEIKIVDSVNDCKVECNIREDCTAIHYNHDTPRCNLIFY